MKTTLTYTLGIVLALGALGLFFFNTPTAEGPQHGAEEELLRKELVTLYDNEAKPDVSALPARPSEQTNLDSQKKATGVIHFTSEYGDNFDVRRFIIDLDSSNKFAQPVPAGNGNYHLFPEYFSKESPGEYLSFHALGEGDYQLQQANLADKSIRGLEGAVGKYPGYLNVSPDASHVAFQRLRTNFSTTNDLLPIKNWEIVVYDLINEKIIMTIEAATQPQWSPKGDQLVFLRSGGLYARSLNSGAEAKVLAAGAGDIITTSMLDLSPDGSLLLWTTPKSFLISLFEINWGEEITISLADQVVDDGTEFYWPLFSPEGTHYVVQAIDHELDAQGYRTNPRYEIRSTSNHAIEHYIPMDGFNFSAFFTDDWVMQ